MELKATARNDDVSNASSLSAIALALSQIALTQSAILERLAPRQIDRDPIDQRPVEAIAQPPIISAASVASIVPLQVVDEPVVAADISHTVVSTVKLDIAPTAVESGVVAATAALATDLAPIEPSIASTTDLASTTTLVGSPIAADSRASASGDTSSRDVSANSSSGNIPAPVDNSSIPVTNGSPGPSSSFFVPPRRRPRLMDPGEMIDHVQTLTSADGKWYVVSAGKAPGIYGHWDEVSPLVTRVSCAIYKKHASLDEALDAYTRAWYRNAIQYIA